LALANATQGSIDVNGVPTVTAGGNPVVVQGVGDSRDATVVACTLLPVELIEFTAVEDGDDTRLNWVTASEENNDRFVVEYSTDGINFNNIGEVLGQGTTDAATRYDFVHQRAGSFSVPVLYYRLLQVDYDGYTTYSDIVILTLDENQSKHIIFPNIVPKGRDVTIAGSDIRSIYVYSISGQLMDINQYADSQGVILPTGSLSRGSYIVIVNNETHLRLIIQ